MRLLIGIDGGGTKTAVTAAEVRDCAPPGESIQREALLPSASWREHGAEFTARMLRDGVDALAQGDEIIGVALALPYIGESRLGDTQIDAALGEAFAGMPYLLVNDSVAGWAGSLALESGVNIVAGTGAIAYGRDAGGMGARCGGWDEFFSDEGSCYWLGRAACALFARESDGRAPRGPLYDIVRAQFALDEDFEFIDAVHDKLLVSREQVAAMQLLLMRAAIEGDVSACALYDAAAQELCLLLDGIRGRISLPESGFPVSYSGGLFKAGELILKPFRRGIESRGGRLVVPRLTPAQGALLLAAERFAPGALRTLGASDCN